jgi:hypothetical protein
MLDIKTTTGISAWLTPVSTMNNPGFNKIYLYWKRSRASNWEMNGDSNFEKSRNSQTVALEEVHRRATGDRSKFTTL